MVTWTNKQWGALIGGVVLLVIAWLGFGAAALVVIGGVVGYFIKAQVSCSVVGKGSGGQVEVCRLSG